jgi:hypothetical protein
MTSGRGIDSVEPPETIGIPVRIGEAACIFQGPMEFDSIKFLPKGIYVGLLLLGAATLTASFVFASLSVLRRN